MDTGMIVVSTILIALCALPFILITGNYKKKEKQLKKKLVDAITKNSGILTDFVINTNFAMGLDRNANHMYFYKTTSETDSFQIVNLNQIATCNVKRENKRIKKGKIYEEVIQAIALVFKNEKGDVINEFELYDYDKSSQLNGEIAIADMWRNKVVELLPTKHTTSKELMTEKQFLVFA